MNSIRAKHPQAITCKMIPMRSVSDLPKIGKMNLPVVRQEKKKMTEYDLLK